MSYVLNCSKKVNCIQEINEKINLSQEFLYQSNSETNFKCSLDFYASKHCQLIPKWYDLVNNETITKSDDEVNYGVENQRFWFSFQSKFNFSMAFNCNDYFAKISAVYRVQII